MINKKLLTAILITIGVTGYSIMINGCNTIKQTQVTTQLKTILCVKHGNADEFKFYSDADIALITSTLDKEDCEQIIIDK